MGFVSVFLFVYLPLPLFPSHSPWSPPFAYWLLGLGLFRVTQ